MRLVETRWQESNQSTARYCLWEVDPGAYVESSVLHMSGRDVESVVCLPSSVGCSAGCAMCAMPQSFSPRPLLQSEFDAILSASLGYFRAENGFQVSFMGQGEPLLRPKGVFEFCNDLVRAYEGVLIGISTVGIPQGLRTLQRQPWMGSVKLQLSVHAWPSEKRLALVPAERQYPLQESLRLAREFYRRSGQRVCLNVVLLEGVNDTLHDAKLIASLAQPRETFYVKVSKYNPHDRAGFRASSEHVTREYCEALRRQGAEFHVFESLGTSIGAGCGQTKISVRSDLSATSRVNAKNP